ncbi:MAG: recombinase family protein [Candidatus Ventricola sp.]
MPDNRKKIMYLRLSKEDGDVEEGNVQESCSIASQRQCLQSYMASQPELEPDEFMEIVDDGYSGTNMNRPGITHLIGLVEAGEVKTIIVRDLSRFSRNYLEAGHYLEFIFPAYGVRFISVNDHFDSKALGEETGGLELAIRNLINDMYSRDISRKIKSAVNLKKMNGEYVYGAVPYGYKKGQKKNTIVIDEPAAKVVRRIFEWAAEGATITQIANRLNDAGVQTPSVYLAAVRGKYRTRSFWTYESVRNILNNRIYTGDTEPFKSNVVKVGSNHVRHIPEAERMVIPNTHEAIVSRKMYEQAKCAVKSNRKSEPSAEKNPLTSYLVCGCCGNRLAKGKSQNRIWRCSSGRYSGSLACGQARADDAKMKDVLLRAIQNQARLLNARIERLAASEKDKTSEAEIIGLEIRKLRRQIESLRAEKMTAYERYASAEVGKEEYLRVKTALSEHEESAKAQLHLLEESLKNTRSACAQMKETRSSANGIIRYAEIDELTPGIMRKLIKRVVVFPDNRISIEWNFRDDMIRYLEVERVVQGKEQ